MGEHVVQGDTHPGHVGTACLLSSSFLENGKDNGVATLPIMGRNSRQTLGKVRGKILKQGIPNRTTDDVALQKSLLNLFVNFVTLFQWTTW